KKYYVCITKEKYMVVNKTVFDMATIFENNNVFGCYEILNSLADAKEDIEMTLDLYKNEVMTQLKRKEVASMKLQLHYLELNIKIVENAILAHESKLFERNTILGV